MNAVENPFSASRVRPGAMPYLFAGLPCGAGVPAASDVRRRDACATNAESLVARLRDNGWRGQIVGPHGSGKSALLAALIPAIGRAGQSVLLVELHDAQRRLPREFWRDPRLATATLLVVDGYEQLGLWSRFRLKRLVGPVANLPVSRQVDNLPHGLLVTAHASVGLPDLCRTAVDLELACRVAAHFQQGHVPLVGADDVAERFPRHAGNLRELLFDLYDLYEQRRRAQP